MGEPDEVTETAELNDSLEQSDTLARMRELERLEEMEELDSIVDRAERNGSAEGAPHGTGVHGSPALGPVHAAADAPTGKVLSPSDLFLQMRQVDEGASRPSQETSPAAPQAQRHVDDSRSTP